METLPLILEKGLIFVILNGKKWLLDTGAPASFGGTPKIQIDGKNFLISRNFMSFNKDSLVRELNIELEGLIGNDVINQFDFLFDVEHQTVTISNDHLKLEGQNINLSYLIGSPLLKVTILSQEFTTIFDTGAEINYILDDIIQNFEPMGRFEDYNPILGKFSTETYNVEITIGGILFRLRCGKLPEIGSAPLQAFGVKGIIGNSILHERVVGYFPRRRLLVL